MKLVDGWWWPDGERHMIDWLATPKNRVMINGRPAYQGKKQLACLEHLKADRRRTMIDVGAHIGLWSFNFAHWFLDIKAFEPVEAHRECFTKNVPNEIDSVVALHPFALGDHEAMVSISVNPSSSGDSWIKGRGTVPMKTIDSFNFQDVDFIKVDCEGYEEFVLRGAHDTIQQWKPFICVEQKRDMAVKFDLKPLGAVVYLKSLGYTTVNEMGGDFMMKHAG
jgi:FkbM family methyltransferase